MYKENNGIKSVSNKTTQLRSPKSKNNLDTLSHLNVTFDQEFIDRKRKKSLKLFNSCEIFRFLSKNFPEIIYEENLEISLSLSKSILKEQKTMVSNSQKTKLFFINLKEKVLNSNTLLLTEENLICTCAVLVKAFKYAKDMKVANLKHFFELFSLDLEEVYENIQKTEKIRLESLKIFSMNKSKKQEIFERKNITLLKSFSSFFTFGINSSSSNRNSTNNAIGCGSTCSKIERSRYDDNYFNKGMFRKEKGFNRTVHEELNCLLEILLSVKSVHFFLPETEKKFKFLFLFFVNIELLLPNIYQVHLNFESKISNINSVEGNLIYLHIIHIYLLKFKHANILKISFYFKTFFVLN